MSPCRNNFVIVQRKSKIFVQWMEKLMVGMLEEMDDKNKMVKKNKKGLSQVVGTVVLIMITVALIGGTWGFINSFISEKLESAGACKDIFGKVSLNSQYTCFNVTDNTTLFSVKIGVLEIDGLLISIGYEEDNIVISLTNESVNIANVSRYGAGPGPISMPNSESTRTYVLANNNNRRPIEVGVSPKMGNTQCDFTDRILNLDSCL